MAKNVSQGYQNAVKAAKSLVHGMSEILIDQAKVAEVTELEMIKDSDRRIYWCREHSDKVFLL